MTKKYIVLHETLFQGWVNCWTDTVDGVETPTVFDTREEAQAEIDEFLADIRAQIDNGEREPDEGYSEDEYCIEELSECPDCKEWTTCNLHTHDELHLVCDDCYSLWLSESVQTN